MSRLQLVMMMTKIIIIPRCNLDKNNTPIKLYTLSIIDAKRKQIKADLRTLYEQ